MRKLLRRPNFSAPKQLFFTVKSVFVLIWRIDRRLFLVLLVANILAGLFTLPIIYLDKLIIDVLVNNIGNPVWQRAIEGLALIVSFRLVIQILDDVTARTIGVINNLLSWKFSTRMEIILGEKNSSLDLATIEDPNFKDRFIKVQQDSYGKAWNLVGAAFQIPQSIAGIVSALSILWLFNPAISLVLIGFVIPGFLVDAKFAKLEYEMQSRHATKRRVWQWLVYYLVRPHNFMEIKLSKLSSVFTKKLEALQGEFFSDRVRVRAKKHINLQVVNLPQQIFNAGMTVYLGYLVIIGRFTLGTGQALIRSLDIFRSRMVELLRSFIDIFESNLYVNDLMWFLELDQVIDGTKGVKFPEKIQSGIVFDHVWFRYKDEDPWILRDVSFTINPQENIALIGDNGAGKTTLIKLLSRFYDPQRGQIWVDGKPLSEYARDSFWDYYAVLFQTFETYAFTARESIGYGNLSKLNDLATIRSFAKKSDIDDYIMSLPKQYENPISAEFDGGVTPSFGQLQRIGIARSLIKDSQILVLDEPTSNVDPQAEEDIFNEVLKLGKEKILIFISHRFSTVRKADRILVLEKGKIAEQGSHEKLIEENGKYAKLFRLQAKSYK